MTFINQEDKIEAELEQKLLVSRDGGLRNAIDQDDCFVDDACAILEIERPEADVFCDHYDECPADCTGTNPEFSDDLANEYETQLFDAGFYVFRNPYGPGDYIIYDKGLSEEAQEALRESAA